MQYNIALLLPFLLFWAALKGWQWWRGRDVSPTPPVDGDIVESSEVSALEPSAPDRQGRAVAPAIDTSPTGVKGAWIKVQRPSEDDDND